MKFNNERKVTTMTNTGKLITGVAIGAIAVFALVTLLDVDISGETELPSVAMEGGNIELPEIETSGGEMPNVDVNTADIEVREREATVTVPTDVETEERDISYPSVDVTLPEDN
jgi:hypothetical protein